MTIRELAAKANMAKSSVQAIGDGQVANVGTGTLADLARALQVRPAWLAFGDGEP